MSNWIPTHIGLPTEGTLVWTKIDDKDGLRNVKQLKRKGRLWFVKDGSAYVYYTPTHWKP